MHYFVTAIGTDSGKTLASAILVEAFQAHYWKPVQAGLPKDADTIQKLVSHSGLVIHPETYFLQMPASPHAAAKAENIDISVEDFKLPAVKENLIIEGAGGLMVPLNDHELVIDLIAHLKAPVVLVANLYLGSINHSLLSLEALKSRDIKVKGIIFNGQENRESERIILHYADAPCVLRIHPEININPELVTRYAAELRKNWHE